LEDGGFTCRLEGGGWRRKGEGKSTEMTWKNEIEIGLVCLLRDGCRSTPWLWRKLVKRIAAIEQRERKRKN